MKKLGVTAALTVMLSSQMMMSAHADTLFKDIQNSGMKTQIEALAKAGAISGYSDGTFHPKENVTRLQFAKMLSLAMNYHLDAGAAKNFKDVPTAYKPYVGALLDEGVTAGVTATTYNSTAYITRQDMATMFVRAMGLEDYAILFDFDSKFKDYNVIAGRSQAQVAFLENIGFLSGSNGKFNPGGPSTREAVAKFIYQMKFEENKFMERALNLFAQNFYYDVVKVDLINSDEIQLYYKDGTSEMWDVSFMLEDIASTSTYDSFAALDGSDWVTFNSSDKKEIAGFIVEYWDSAYSYFNYYGKGDYDQVASQVIQKLNTFYSTSANRNTDVVTASEKVGIQNGIIKEITTSGISKAKISAASVHMEKPMHQASIRRPK